MVSNKVANGWIGTSPAATTPGLVIVQVTHGQSENLGQARCSLTIKETEKFIKDLQESIEKAKKILDADSKVPRT